MRKSFNFYIIIPSVLIPLGAVTFLLTSIASTVAAWFGIKLSTEGPRKMLELMLKKRVIVSALVLNVVFYGIYQGVQYCRNSASPLFFVQIKNKKLRQASTKDYEDSWERPHAFHGPEKSFHLGRVPNLEIEWATKLPKGSFRSSLISSGSVFLGNDDGHLYELDANTGAVLRKFFVGTDVTTRPIIYKNRIYVGEGSHDTHHARIYSFDLKTGEFLGAFQTKGHTEGQMIVADFQGKQLLFAVAGKDGLYAIDPLSLQEVWHQVDGHIDATVTVDGGIVYVGTGVEKESRKRERSYAIAYDFNSGKRIWKRELPASNWMHPAVTAHQVCYALGEIYLEADAGYVACFNKLSGAPDFILGFDAPLVGKPFLLNTKLFVSDLNGKICGIDLALRERLWCTATDDPKPGQLVLSSVEYDGVDDILWYASQRKGLFALDPNTGKQLVNWNPGFSSNEGVAKSKAFEIEKWGITYAAPTYKAGDLYISDMDGRYRRLHIKN